MTKTDPAFWLEQVYEAVWSNEENPAQAIKTIEGIVAAIDRLPERIFESDRFKFESTRSYAIEQIAGVYSILGNFESAYNTLSNDRLPRGATFRPIRVLERAYMLHHMGRSAEAGALVANLIGSEDESEFLDLSEGFFALLRYRQFDLAQQWINAKRNPETSAEKWLEADGVGLLHRLEAALRLEMGQHERALVSYDKAVKFMLDDASPIELAEDLVVAGRPNLALRILRRERKATEEHLWYGLALRALGRNDEAKEEFAQVADINPDDDPYFLLNWALANCYVNPGDEEVFEIVAEQLELGGEMLAPMSFALAATAAQHPPYEEEMLIGLKTAQRESRRDFIGHHLNRTEWYHATQLFPPERQALTAPFFDPTLMPLRII